MDDGEDANRLLPEAVDDEVRQVDDDHLAGAVDAAGPAEVRVGGGGVDGGADRCMDARRRVRDCPAR